LPSILSRTCVIESSFGVRAGANFGRFFSAEKNVFLSDTAGLFLVGSFHATKGGQLREVGNESLCCGAQKIVIALGKAKKTFGIIFNHFERRRDRTCNLLIRSQAPCHWASRPFG
jgi:hypothetical protein